MDALQLYASDSDSDNDPNGNEAEASGGALQNAGLAQNTDGRAAECFSLIGTSSATVTLPPPPPPSDLLSSFPDLGTKKRGAEVHGGRVRSFGHVEGNYALHIYIPVALPTIVRDKLAPLLKKACTLLPGLLSMEDDVVPLVSIPEKGVKLASQYHISLGRTVPIRIHQIETIVPMLRQKFGSQKRFWMEFGRWEAFINDERTRSFLCLEIVGVGTSEIRKQVSLVNEVYKLHNLPAFYKNPRPHISLAWALGDTMEPLRNAAIQVNNIMGNQEHGSGLRGEQCLWSSQTRRVECKIGQKVYSIWTANP